MTTLNSSNVWMKGTASDLNQKAKDTPSDSIYRAWKTDPSPTNTESLLKELTPTIESALTSYAPDHKSTLRTKARLMALNAAKMYDPNHSAKLTSYVFNNLKSLNREKAKRTNIVHIPENVILERNRINKEKDAFVAEEGREPTLLELADKTGLSLKRIENAEKHGNQLSASQLLSEKGDSLFSKASDPSQVWADYVYHDLDRADKKVFEWSTGYGGTKKIPKGEIAKRLKISPAAVSRRISKIISMLERGYNV